MILISLNGWRRTNPVIDIGVPTALLAGLDPHDCYRTEQEIGPGSWHAIRLFDSDNRLVRYWTRGTSPVMARLHRTRRRAQRLTT